MAKHSRLSFVLFLVLLIAFQDSSVGVLAISLPLPVLQNAAATPIAAVAPVVQLSPSYSSPAPAPYISTPGSQCYTSHSSPAPVPAPKLPRTFQEFSNKVRHLNEVEASTPGSHWNAHSSPTPKGFAPAPYGKGTTPTHTLKGPTLAPRGTGRLPMPIPKVIALAPTPKGPAPAPHGKGTTPVPKGLALAPQLSTTGSQWNASHSSLAPAPARRFPHAFQDSSRTVRHLNEVEASTAGAPGSHQNEPHLSPTGPPQAPGSHSNAPGQHNGTAPAPAPKGPAPAPHNGTAPAPAPKGPAPAPHNGTAPAPAPKGPAPAPHNGTAPAPTPKAPPPEHTLPPSSSGGDVPAQKPRTSKGMSGGQKAGTVIGVFAAVGLIGFAAMVYRKRQSNIRRARFGSVARNSQL